MRVTISDECFEKAVDEECKKNNFGDDEKFRFAIAVLARDVYMAAEWTGFSPPTLIHAALAVVTRAYWDSF